MKQVNIGEAKARFSRLVAEAAAGEEIVIARAGKPVARLVALAAGTRRRRPGALKGRIRMLDTFDDPLPPDIARSFGSEE